MQPKNIYKIEQISDKEYLLLSKEEAKNISGMLVNTSENKTIQHISEKIEKFIKNK